MSNPICEVGSGVYSDPSVRCTSEATQVARAPAHEVEDMKFCAHHAEEYGPHFEALKLFPLEG